MRLFLLGFVDMIGFVALCTSAVLVSLVLSLFRLSTVVFLAVGEKIWKIFRRLNQITTMTRTHKNGSNWIVVRIWKFSFLLGVKDADKAK